MIHPPLAAHTLAGPLEFSGVGVHSGRPVRMALRPSEGGIVFRRLDLDGAAVALDPEAAFAVHSTGLESGGVRVETVEHLLAAFSGCGIDAAVVELDAAELPILDGSARPYVRAILETGRRPLPSARRVLEVTEPFRVETAEGFLEAEPDRRLRIEYSIAFRHPALGESRLALTVDEAVFADEIAPARTFGFLKDADALRARGLALGSSLENTVVFDDAGVVNGPLRFPDEPVRHKILDLVGDLYLAGRPVRGLFRAFRAGHALHLKALKRLAEEERTPPS